ncbi:hypothetical protein SCG7086_DE_00010, partial [Chlamydiales bacterium SCGC AG-110-P3]
MPDDSDPDPMFTNRDVALDRETVHPKQYLMHRINSALDSCRSTVPTALADVLLLSGSDHYPEMIRRMLIAKGFSVL